MTVPGCLASGFVSLTERRRFRTLTEKLREKLLTESIIIVGAGITGLGTALALAKAGRNVTILERDPPPPETSVDDAFDVWERKGVGHLRHSHAFLAVLYRLIKTEYPELLAQLVKAGCRELKFADGLSDEVRKTYVPDPDDDSLTILTSRRTTLEYVMRRYVDTLEGVTIETDVTVRGILLEERDGAKVTTGLQIDKEGETSERLADIIIDAGGRNSQLVPWLIKKGIKVPESEDDAGILYYTRHYRLNEGYEEPEAGSIPGAGDLGYIKYGVFPADHGCFSVTFALPEVEMEMRKSIQRNETFDALCDNLPGLARWTDAKRSRPVGKVLGMGDIRATWRTFVQNGTPAVLGFFAVGDAAIRTNPLYGRGCSLVFCRGTHLLKCSANTMIQERVPWCFMKKLKRSSGRSLRT